jgi:hypothetical protein
MSTSGDIPPVSPPGNDSAPPPLPPPRDPEMQWRMKSFDFVADATKQLIAVATGVITVTVIFSRDLSPLSRWLAVSAWSALLISVFCGVLTLLNMSGLLAALATGGDAYNAKQEPKKSKGGAAQGINETGNRYLAGAQLAAFLVGLVLVLIFGFVAAHGNGSSDTEKALSQAVTVTCLTPSAPPPPAAGK